jgi:hypothetical protein
MAIVENPLPHYFDTVPRELIRHWNTADKAEWDEGPWQAEPDKIHWVDPHTNYDCLMVRNEMGAWCGYVGIPPGHPWHGKGPREIDAEAHHGRVNYAQECQEWAEADPSKGVCHVPFPGRPTNVWWVGFDCGHGTDYHPAAVAYWREVASVVASGCFVRPERYRDVPYVLSNVLLLVVQAVRAHCEATGARVIHVEDGRVHAH